MKQKNLGSKKTDMLVANDLERLDATDSVEDLPQERFVDAWRKVTNVAERKMRRLRKEGEGEGKEWSVAHDRLKVKENNKKQQNSGRGELLRAGHEKSRPKNTSSRSILLVEI